MTAVYSCKPTILDISSQFTGRPYSSKAMASNPLISKDEGLVLHPARGLSTSFISKDEGTMTQDILDFKDRSDEDKFCDNNAIVLNVFL